MIKNLKMILKFLNRNLSNHYYLYLSSTYRKFPNFGVKYNVYVIFELIHQWFLEFLLLS
jgi:hypothetical protein